MMSTGSPNNVISFPLVSRASRTAPRSIGSLERKIRATPLPSVGRQPTVTVVITCYNYERYLPQAICSALDQTGVEVDVIVVDDASTDGSLAAARELEARDSRVIVIEHMSNKGPVETFNDGLALASGEFLVRLDADDLLTPGSLARAVAVMRYYPTVGLVYGHPLHFSGDNLPAARKNPTGWTIWPGREWLTDRCANAYNVITSPEAFIRRSVVDQIGGLQPLAHTHDMELWLRIAAFSDVAYIHGADQAWHREHSASLSARKVDSLRDIQERVAAFDVLFAGAAGGIDGAREMRAAAMEAIAAQAVTYATREYDHGRDSAELVKDLIETARAAVPDLESVTGWKGLERRMKMGARRAGLHPQSFVARGRRRMLDRLSKRRWHKTGEF